MAEESSRGNAAIQDLMSLEDILKIESSVLESIIFKLEPSGVAKEGIAETQKMDDQIKE
jgi:hypothetical protein